MPITRTRTRFELFRATSTVSPSTTWTTRPEYANAPVSRASTSPAKTDPSAATAASVATMVEARSDLAVNSPIALQPPQVAARGADEPVLQVLPVPDLAELTGLKAPVAPREVGADGAGAARLGCRRGRSRCCRDVAEAECARDRDGREGETMPHEDPSVSDGTAGSVDAVEATVPWPPRPPPVGQITPRGGCPPGRRRADFGLFRHLQQPPGAVCAYARN